jgi:hypothetical protein
MATTATNKLPLLGDRPLFRVRRLDLTSSPPDTVDPGTGSNGVLLVDCTANEGALIEDIYLVQRVGGDQTPVNLYLSNSSIALGVTVTGGAADAFFIAQTVMEEFAPAGTTSSFLLPTLLAPVPHAAVGGYELAIGQAPQFSGLRVERGYALWAASDYPAASADAPNIAIQGMLY